MRRLFRWGIAIALTVGAGVGTWAVLQSLKINDGLVGAAAVGAASIAAVFVVDWVRSSDGRRWVWRRRVRPDTGSLKGVRSSFAGRAEEWQEIKSSVMSVRSSQRIHVSILIRGMAGIGKSEFALYAAHELVSILSKRARRADLTILACYVELHSFDGLGRRDVADALRSLLASDGLDERRSSVSLDQLSGAWRKSLHGKLLILLLDDVDDENQIIPFLPGGSDYVLLATSRRIFQAELAGELKPIDLEKLRPKDADSMIEKVVGRPLGRDDEKAIRGIGELCWFHPLAIRLSVRSLADDRYTSFAERAAQLRATQNRLLALDEYEQRGGMARAFGRSYLQLPEDCKLTLRSLSLVPLRDISAEAVAAMADIPIAVAVNQLSTIKSESLIERDDEGYHLHDLIREYSRSLASQDDMDDGPVNRLFAYYYQATVYVDSVLTRQPPPVSIDPPTSSISHTFTDRRDAILWIRTEQLNLQNCAQYVMDGLGNSESQQAKRWVIMFASSLAGILRNDGKWAFSLKLQTSAIVAAEELQIPLAMANALHERGLLKRLVDDQRGALTDLEQAIRIYRDIGGKAGLMGEAHALNTAGVVLDRLSRRSESDEFLVSALGIYQRLDSQLGQANVLQDQGMSELFAGQSAAAASFFSRALTLYEDADHLLGKAHARNYLARAQRQSGLEREAAENLLQAQQLYHDLGNQLGEITTQNQRGAAVGRIDYGQGSKILNDAMHRSLEIGSQPGLVDAMYELGMLHRINSDNVAAIRIWNHALEICREYDLQREEKKLLKELRSLGAQYDQ